jgi:hypothetical protein
MGFNMYEGLDRYKNTESIERTFEIPSSDISIGIISGVDVKTRTVSVRHIGSSTEDGGIPYLSPQANEDFGIDAIPKRGDLCAVASTSAGTKIILGFIGGAKRSGDILTKEGDFILKTRGGFIFKGEDEGGMFKGTERASFSNMKGEGDIVNSFLESTENIGTEGFSYRDKTGIKRISDSPYFNKLKTLRNESYTGLIIDSYEKLIRLSTLPINDAISLIESNARQVGAATYSREGKGDAVDSPGDIDQIGSSMGYNDVLFNRSVVDANGDVISFFKMDEKGNIQIAGNDIIVMGENFDAPVGYPTNIIVTPAMWTPIESSPFFAQVSGGFGDYKYIYERNDTDVSKNDFIEFMVGAANSSQSRFKDIITAETAGMANTACCYANGKICFFCEEVPLQDIAISYKSRRWWW